MHIAVCDDNVADRKQLERLLGRESDKRKHSTGVFYTDSFGDSIVLGRNPMSYDLFFIDLAHSEPNGLAFAIELLREGVTAPIVLCHSEIDYKARASIMNIGSAELMFIKKPIQTKELSALLDQAILLLESRIPTIELRAEKETFYVQEDDIVCAVVNGRYVNVTLYNGKVVPILSSMSNFYSHVALYTHFVPLTQKALINIAYLAKFTALEVILKNGTKIKSSPLALSNIKSALLMYQQEAHDSLTNHVPQ